jgi:hypothetical protein
VYRKNADRGDRAALGLGCARIARKAPHRLGHVDYDGGFDLVEKQNGKAVPDTATIRALGLTMPGPAN